MYVNIVEVKSSIKQKRHDINDDIPNSVKTSKEMIKNFNEKLSDVGTIKKEEVPVVVEDKEVKDLTVKDIIAKLKASQRYEEVLLPSRNISYEDIGLERDKPITVIPTTIEEEKIFSTLALLRTGQAIDQIFSACISEEVPVGRFFAADRVFLLFYIRGISYGVEYEVQIKCPSCNSQFAESINLDTLLVERCNDDFNGSKTCTLPNSKLNITFRYPRGDDERNLLKYRDTIIKGFGAQAVDDTIVRRNTMLVTRIENITNRNEIEMIMNNLSVMDSNYIRDQIDNPGFGIDTEIGMNCIYCYNEWRLSLPIDASFFYPRTKKA